MMSSCYRQAGCNEAGGGVPTSVARRELRLLERHETCLTPQLTSPPPLSGSYSEFLIRAHSWIVAALVTPSPPPPLAAPTTYPASHVMHGLLGTGARNHVVAWITQPRTLMCLSTIEYLSQERKGKPNADHWYGRLCELRLSTAGTFERRQV